MAEFSRETNLLASVNQTDTTRSAKCTRRSGRHRTVRTAEIVKLVEELGFGGVGSRKKEN